MWNLPGKSKDAKNLLKKKKKVFNKVDLKDEISLD